MRKRLSGPRLALVGLVLALALSACSFSTDTVATVGGERITRGELNAAVDETNAAYVRIAALRNRGLSQPLPPRTITPPEMLQELVLRHQLEAAARDNKIRITPAEFTAQSEIVAKSLVADQQSSRDKGLVGLAAGAAAELRPIINNYGGSIIPEAELQAIAQQEVERLRSLLLARSTVMAVDSATLRERTIKDQAITFRNVLAQHGVAVAPESLEPLTADLIQTLDRGGYIGSDADYFQQALLASGVSNPIYKQYIRRLILQEKLRPLWLPTEIEAVFLQELRTDSRDKALAAIQQGRSGTSFADLLKTYQIASIPPRANDNLLPSSYVLALDPQFQAGFKVVKEGEFSEPFATSDNRQFTINRIAKIEKRAPTTNEANKLFAIWGNSLGTKYPVTILDTALNMPVR